MEPVFTHIWKFYADTFPQRVCGMGFDEAAVRAALEKHAWDENAAVNALLGAM